MLRSEEAEQRIFCSSNESHVTAKRSLIMVLGVENCVAVVRHASAGAPLHPKTNDDGNDS